MTVLRYHESRTTGVRMLFDPLSAAALLEQLDESLLCLNQPLHLLRHGGPGVRLLRDSARDRDDRVAVGAELRVPQILPVDGHRYRRLASRARGIRRDRGLRVGVAHHVEEEALAATILSLLHRHALRI